MFVKKGLLIAAMFVAFGVITFCATDCRAQMMVGGYRETSKTDEYVVNAANFAVETQSAKDASLKLISVEKAERQIVAGSNYRMCLAVDSNGKPQQATAIVYVNLKNEYSLSNWTDGNCSASTAKQTAQSETVESSEAETVNYKGELQVGKTDSVILYLGEESGDYAAFCFANKSTVGRKVLAACKNRGQCEFTGEVDFGSSCKVKGLQASLSASAKIVKINSVKTVARRKAAMVKTSITAPAPDAIVKNLYAAQSSEKDAPFFQNTNRAAVDKYFAKDFADLIWKDAPTADGIGTINFDPLYNAQDSKITNFKIAAPEYDAISGIAVVLVSFKNFGKADSVRFQLEQDAAKTWKIIDIVYQNGDMLKGILYSSQNGANN
ncbi:MAG: hypothetical protein H7Z37_18970 [Pyrinomonadaceae bacterium]|nr:hypothetical protein [Pyrinomonadaceae bacterium]